MSQATRSLTLIWPDQPAAREPAADRAYLRPVAAAIWSAILTGLLVYLLIYFDFAAQLIAYPFDFDQGEGYDVNSGLRIARGGWIYNNNDVYPFYSSNYPPVFSLLLAGLIQIFGPSIGVGRALSMAAAIATAALILAIARRDKVVWPVAIAGGLIYLASPYVFHTTPLARVNALAILLATAAVWALGRATWTGTAIGVGLALLALYTKQTTVDAIGAGLLFLLWRNWRQGLAGGTALAVLGAAIFWWIDSASRGQFWLNIIAGNVNAFSWAQAQHYFSDYVSLHLTLVGGAAASVLWAALHGRVNAFHFFWLVSLPFSLTAGKWGAGESYFLGNIAASCICLTWLVGELWRGRTTAWWGRAIVPTAILAQLVIFAHGPLNHVVPGWYDRSVQSTVLGQPPSAEDTAEGWRLAAYFDRQPGPVLAEENGFVLATGGEIVGNASHLRNLYTSGDWDPTGLIREIDARRFSAIVLSGYHYPAIVMDALGRHYRSAERFRINGFGYLVLVRRDE